MECVVPKGNAWGDSNARPLVPEFSKTLLSCWFALLFVADYTLVFPGIWELLFRNRSEDFPHFVTQSSSNILLRF